MVDGRVLIASAPKPWTTPASFPSVEIYDPDQPTGNQFTTPSGAPTAAPGEYWVLTRLRDGRALLVRGRGQACYFFDPDTNQFTPAGNGPGALLSLTGVHTLPDGRVLAVGGVKAEGDPSFSPSASGTYTPVTTIEIFDPAAKNPGFVPAPYSLHTPRESPGTALLRNGQVIVIGGNSAKRPSMASCTDVSWPTLGTQWDVQSSVEIVDPVGSRVSDFGTLGTPPNPFFLMAVGTLLDGSLVVAGGAQCGDGKADESFWFMKGILE